MKHMCTIQKYIYQWAWCHARKHTCINGRDVMPENIHVLMVVMSRQKTNMYYCGVMSRQNTNRYNWGVMSRQKTYMYNWGVTSRQNTNMYNYGVASRQNTNMYNCGVMSRQKTYMYNWGVMSRQKTYMYMWAWCHARKHTCIISHVVYTFSDILKFIRENGGARSKKEKTLWNQKK